MTQSKQTALPAGFLLEEYSIVRELSSGGFSQVYLALDSYDRKYAIKEYLPLNMTARGENGAVTIVNELDQEAFRLGLKCFFEEARVLSCIEHKNIVRVVNFFRANNTVYMVMEYAEGRPLGKEIEMTGGRLQEARLRRMFAELISGLREVHLQHLLHLDIKPANIYLRRNGSPLLLDFGAARQTVLRPGGSFSNMFTPGYAAPEQYDAKADLGPWTDIYGLGACLYTLMGGGKPLSADERLRNDTLIPASKAFVEYYSPELLSLVDACLILSPEKRLTSLIQMQKFLQSTDYVTPPPPVSFWKEPGAWVRRVMGKTP